MGGAGEGRGGGQFFPRTCHHRTPLYPTTLRLQTVCAAVSSPTPCPFLWGVSRLVIKGMTVNDLLQAYLLPRILPALFLLSCERSV